LETFISECIGSWQRDCRENPEHFENAAKIIAKRFHNINNQRYSLMDYDNYLTLTSVLKKEIFDCYGESCWNAAELELNTMEPTDRDVMTLIGVIEFLYLTCLEHL
jgi:hypothetical protein